MGLIIKAESVKGKCKYHRSGDIYTIYDLAPKGMCLDAYYSAYPYCLALSEGAIFGWMKHRDPDAVFTQCSQGVIIMEIKRYVFDAGKKKIIIIRVVDQRGPCPNMSGGFRKKDEFLFNLGWGGEICPAAFHSIYPYLGIRGCDDLRLAEKRFESGRRGLLIECPDDKNRVIFLIRKIKKTG